MKLITISAGGLNNKRKTTTKQGGRNNKPKPKLLTGGCSPTCPQCRARKSQVTDSRQSTDKIRRRRRCLHCGQRWTTYEVTEGLNPPTDYNI